MTASVRLVAITKPVTPECESAADFIAYCARVSNPDNQANHDTAQRLIDYLARHAHWSPFEMSSMTLEIVTTRTIARQILRHRSFSFQEWSGRYSEMPNEGRYSEPRLQDKENRQSSIATDDEDLSFWWRNTQETLYATARFLYDTAISKGIAKELARNLLPEGLTESRLYMAGTIRSWIHYCQLRCLPGTQLEHREIAHKAKLILLNQIPSLKSILSNNNED